MYPRIRILDASTGDSQEEEDFYQEEGKEDHFDQYTTQGKLVFLHAFTNASEHPCKPYFGQQIFLQDYPSAKLHKSKAPLLFTLCL